MRLSRDFFERDALEVAPDLLGKALVSRLPGLPQRRLIISETEVYRGEEDTACHAHRGRTPHRAALYGRRPLLHISLLRHPLAAERGHRPGRPPQGVLIRACRGYEGPGKLTKYLGVTGELNCAGVDICPHLWFEDEGRVVNITTAPRVGIAYASAEDRVRPWRFIEVK